MSSWLSVYQHYSTALLAVFAVSCVIQGSYGGLGIEVGSTCEEIEIIGGGWAPVVPQNGFGSDATSFVIETSALRSTATLPPNACSVNVGENSTYAWFTVDSPAPGLLGISTCNSTVPNIVAVWPDCAEANQTAQAGEPYACQENGGCGLGAEIIAEDGAISVGGGVTLYVQIELDSGDDVGDIVVDLEWLGGNGCGDGLCIEFSEDCFCEDDCGPIDYNGCSSFSDRFCVTWDEVQVEPDVCVTLLDAGDIAWTPLTLADYADTMGVYLDSLVIDGVGFEDGEGCEQIWEYLACAGAWPQCRDSDPEIAALPLQGLCEDACLMIASVCPRIWELVESGELEVPPIFTCESVEGDCLPLPDCPDGFVESADGDGSCLWDPIALFGGPEECEDNLCSGHGECLALAWSPRTNGELYQLEEWPSGGYAIACDCDRGWTSDKCDERSGSFTVGELVGIGAGCLIFGAGLGLLGAGKLPFMNRDEAGPAKKLENEA